MNPTYFGIAAATITTLAFVPQAVKVMRDKQTQAISLKMYLLFCTGILLWVVYGVTTKDRPIIVANSITFILASVICSYKIRNRMRGEA
jgi:MtN3 and saliva related transmembrane protein